MKLQNKSKRSYVHSFLDKNFKLVLLKLAPNEIKDIPDEVAKIWLKAKDIIEYVAPQDLKKLEEENKKLKEKLENLDKQNSEPQKAKTTKKAKNTKSKSN